MENRFDSLAKSVSSAMSRRDALWRLGGGLAVVILASLGLAAPGQSAASKKECALCCLTQCQNVNNDRGPNMGRCMRQCLEDGKLVNSYGDIIPDTPCTPVC